MNYMQNGGFRSQPLMRLTLLWTLLFMTGLWITNAFMYFSRMSLSPASVQAHYLGSEEEFSQPKTAGAMLEVTHAHLATMTVVVLLLTHLMIFPPHSDRVKRWLIGLSFGSSLIGESSGWLVRFVHPGFAWLKVGCFALFQTMLALLIVGLGRYLVGRRR